MGHIGLTPQSATMLGGFKAQGRTAEKAVRLYEDALALEAAGCFAIVLEAVPAPVAARITAALAVPTIGIGAGLECDGQVLVWHDLLGLYEGRAPRFVKQYADLSTEIKRAVGAYVDEVRGRRFPEEQHTYSMPEDELALFEEALGRRSHGTSGRYPYAARKSATRPSAARASATSSSRGRGADADEQRGARPTRTARTRARAASKTRSSRRRALVVAAASEDVRAEDGELDRPEDDQRERERREREAEEVPRPPERAVAPIPARAEVERAARRRSSRRTR